MKLRKDSLAGMTLALGIICIAAAALLAWVYSLTEEPIARAKAQKQQEALAKVLPHFTNDPMEHPVDILGPGDTEAVTVYPALDGDKPVGAAVKTYTLKGFSGRFELMVGFDRQGTVTGYDVLSHSETAGLGAKMGQWFASGQPSDPRTIIGKNPSTTRFTVSKDGGDIDGITAATITSRAFLDAVRRAHSAYMDYLSQTAKP